MSVDTVFKNKTRESPVENAENKYHLSLCLFFKADLKIYYIVFI